MGIKRDKFYKLCQKKSACPRLPLVGPPRPDYSLTHFLQ